MSKVLDEPTRVTILKLHAESVGTRRIARELKVSRNSVKKVIESGERQPPASARALLAQQHHAEILDLHKRCKGNLVRVHEELTASGAEVSYQALTAYCRKMGIGYERPLPAGEYHFGPGTEMQHDTSPHDVEMGGRVIRVQTASLVLCHSRMIFIQHYPQFTRFWCKVFLTDALQFFTGSAARCMVDNTHVVVASGSGADMVPAPEMAAFAERFGFTFAAHELGNPDRKGRVERQFHYVENNFLAGRKFQDFAQLNVEAVTWCNKVNASPRRRLHGSARDLFAAEQTKLRPLSLHVPHVYQLHQRVVDNEGYVNVQNNRYSVPWQLMGRALEVHQTKDHLEVLCQGRLVAKHAHIWGARDQRIIDPVHRPPREAGVFARAAREREMPTALQSQPVLRGYLEALRTRVPQKATHAPRILERLLGDYPLPALLAATDEAFKYGMFDLARLETMVIKRLQLAFFNVPNGDDGESDE